MIERGLYLNQLRKYMNKPLVKVITGIRRGGKSAILRLLIDELVHNGVLEEQIIYLNFESFEHAEIETAKQLYAYIKPRVSSSQINYILLDEVQEVDGWEKVVNSCLVDFQADIYITGSNARMLSSELATYLTGRYVELQLHTLSFAEYLKFKLERTGNEPGNKHREFETYLATGGFPVLHISEYPLDTAYNIIYDIYSSAILRDTVLRNKIRNIELLERIVKFVFDNVGSKFSAKNVADFFKSQQRKLDLNTVYNYLNALQSAYIVDRIQRYDIKGKELLKTQEKYFVADHAMIYAVMGRRDRQISGVLENIVMLELKRRGYKVYTGKWGDREIDFVAERQEERIYIQVAYKMEGPETVSREFTPLTEIRDHHPKFVVTMDEFWRDNIEGVKHVNIVDFLLAESY